MARRNMRFTFNIADNEGVRAPITFYGQYDDSRTVAQLKSDIDGMAVLVAAVTDGQITQEEATLQAAGQAAPTNFADSDVSQVGIFDFPNSNNRLHGVAIAALADSVVVNGHINLNDTGVAALVTAIETAGGSMNYTDNNWLQLGTLKDAFRSTRKHRRALKRSSFEV